MEMVNSEINNIQNKTEDIVNKINNLSSLSENLINKKIVLGVIDSNVISKRSLGLEIKLLDEWFKIFKYLYYK